MNEELIEKTCGFLWKTANALEVKDAEISRTLVHDLSEILQEEEITPTTGKICKKCGVIQNESNTFYRLKPKRKQNKAIQKALKKQQAHSKSSKATERTIKRFINSTSMLVVHCKACSFYEKIPTASRSEIHKIKTAERLAHGKSSNTGKEDLNKVGLSRKRKSVETFLNTSASSSKLSTPVSTPKNKKRRSSQLSKLLSNEKLNSPGSSLADFLKTI